MIVRVANLIDRDFKPANIISCYLELNYKLTIVSLKIWHIIVSLFCSFFFAHFMERFVVLTLKIYFCFKGNY